MKNHSKEEMRSAVLDILFKTEEVRFHPDTFNVLIEGLQELFNRRGDSLPNPQYGAVFAQDPNLSGEDGEHLVEVFWDLFREGVITLGKNIPNPKFPQFRLHSNYSEKNRTEVN